MFHILLTGLAIMVVLSTLETISKQNLESWVTSILSVGLGIGASYWTKFDMPVITGIAIAGLVGMWQRVFDLLYVATDAARAYVVRVSKLK